MPVHPLKIAFTLFADALLKEGAARLTFHSLKLGVSMEGRVEQEIEIYLKDNDNLTLASIP